MDGCGFVPVERLVQLMEQATSAEEVQAIVENDVKVWLHPHGAVARGWLDTCEGRLQHQLGTRAYKLHSRLPALRQGRYQLVDGDDGMRVRAVQGHSGEGAACHPLVAAGWASHAYRACSSPSLQCPSGTRCMTP